MPTEKLSVQKILSMLVLLIGLWLVCNGILGTISSYGYLSAMSHSLKVSGFVQILVTLLKTSPALIGLALFYRHRKLVRWMCRDTPGSEIDSISWENAQILSGLTLALLGLWFLTNGIVETGKSQYFLAGLVTIDHPNRSEMLSKDLLVKMRIEVLYPILVGVVLLFGSVKLGKIFGNIIDKTLSPKPLSFEDSEGEST